MAPCYGWRSPHTRGALSPGPASPRGGGSSPHTRGARVQHQPVKAQPRIIPAYAGSTTGRTAGEHRHRDHPRIRGEHPDEPHWIGTFAGSSPHTRGAHDRRSPPNPHQRIIPAYAGSTRPRKRRTPRRGDHPRIRGEHGRQLRYDLNNGGSSPHTRGARVIEDKLTSPSGIIPAYAGSTSRRGARGYRSPDHPRIRGEHPIAAKPDNLVMGSSPHTRGARYACNRYVDMAGIIPAYAGSTLSTTLKESVVQGSSPHTRGALNAGAAHRVAQWIIPAYAGSTTSLLTEVVLAADHPRIRGEHQVLAVPGDALEGSSPHTRGAHRPLVRPRPGARIIPAYAGSTPNR